LIQPQQRGAEVDLGVLEHADGTLAVGEPLHILAGAESTFFDYHAKYTPGAAVFEVPARLAPGVRERLDSLALAAFRTLGCRGFARIDFFVFADGTVALNEVNTIPGMTSLSQYPQIWAAAGIDYPALLDLLLAQAVSAA